MSGNNVNEGVQDVFTEGAEFELRRINKVFSPQDKKGCKDILSRDWNPKNKDAGSGGGQEQKGVSPAPQMGALPGTSRAR